jgi:segregation and condensation protein B
MDLKAVLEAILFSAQKPLSPKELKNVLAAAVEHSDSPEVQRLKRASTETITAALHELAAEHVAAGRSYRLVCVAGAWQFVSQPEYAPWIKALVGHRPRPPRLSQPALETLAIIAYRQPVTRAEVEQVRGVSIDGVLQTLLERGLVQPVGRAELPGRPLTYGTTAAFLEYFGLASLDDLPAADELRRVPVQRPESPPTAEPGLATAPPQQLTLAEAVQPQTPSAAPDQPIADPAQRVPAPQAADSVTPVESSAQTASDTSNAPSDTPPAVGLETRPATS